MTDNEIKKTEDTEVIKIKAIYPHIVVGGTVDKPCYSIDWYDIEAQTMHTGYSSYNLKNVQEWLKEHFEVVEYDIENLINRLQAEVKRLENHLAMLKKEIKKCVTHYKMACTERNKFLEQLKTANAGVERLQKENENFADIGKMYSEIKAEAYKEFAELLKKHSYYDPKDQRKVVSEAIIDYIANLK